MEQRAPGYSTTVRVVEGHLREVSNSGGRSRSIVDSVKEILNYRQLLYRLVSREIRARYKNSSLGIVWSLMRPLAQLLIYYVAIGQFLGASRSIPDFAIFVFTGLTIWTLFAEIVGGGTGSILANAGLVKKVYLPREIFPLSAVGGALFNFGVQFLVLVVATIAIEHPSPTLDWFLAPLSMLLIVVLGTAIALVLSAVNVYLRDVEHLVDIILLVLFWASPIVYSVSSVHAILGKSILLQVYLANPMTLAVLGMQKAMWAAGSQNPALYWPSNLGIRMLIALAISIVLLFLAQRVFARLQGNFAQEL